MQRFEKTPGFARAFVPSLEGYWGVCRRFEGPCLKPAAPTKSLLTDKSVSVALADARGCVACC